MAIKRKLKFLTRVEVKDIDNTIYDEGEELEVDSDTSAERWLRRGVVVEITEKTEKTKK